MALAHRLWMNLYHNGYYHRRGKPGDVNIHGGDAYPTREAAVEAIEPEAGYIATVPIVVLLETKPTTNPGDSVPIPLRETRREIEGGTAAWLA